MPLRPPPNSEPPPGWEAPTGEVLDLVQRVRAGDPRAFDDLFRLYYTPVLKFARVRFSDLRDAEDATMEIFVNLHRALPRLADPRQFVSFLFGIARRIRSYRSFRLGRRRRLAGFESMEDMSEPMAIAAGLILPGVDQVLFEAEARQKVVQAIHRLPVLDREAVLLRFQEEFTYEQMAEVLDIPPETARSRVRQARRRLATMLDLDLTG